MASEAFLQKARCSEQDFTPHRALPLPQLVTLLLNLRKGTNRDELNQFFETITGDPLAGAPVSEAAFCRARKKLKPEALVRLNDALLDSANEQIALRRWQGFRVLAVDGSTARLPNTPAIADYFGKPRGSGVPLARFSRLHDVLNGQTIQADMVPYATGERELASEYCCFLSRTTCSFMTEVTRPFCCLPFLRWSNDITVLGCGIIFILKSRLLCMMASRSVSSP